MSMTSTSPATRVNTRHAAVHTTLGELTLVRDDDGLTGLYFPGHRIAPDFSALGPRIDPAADDVLAAAVQQLHEFLRCERQQFDVPLNPQGSALAHQVWQLIAEIPYGETTTYGAISQRLDGRIGPRAVGGFVGRNPLAIFIGCHRVISSTGKLTGYAGGLERKQYLLTLESRPLW